MDLICRHFRKKNNRREDRIVALNDHLLHAHNTNPPTPSPNWTLLHTQQHTRKKFCSNKIRTTKYRWWNFIFKNLWEQMQRVSNIFFAVVATLQLIPGLSPIGNITVIFPLVSIIVISAIKSAFEDVKRWISDRRVNAAESRRVDTFWNAISHNESGSNSSGSSSSIRYSGSGDFATKNNIAYDDDEEGGRDRLAVQCMVNKVQRKSLRVGDIIEIRQGEEIPADVVLLASNDRQDGKVYLETSKLDGESKSKIKHALEASIRQSNDEKMANLDICCDIVAMIACQAPSADFYDWNGSIEYSRISDLQKSEPRVEYLDTGTTMQTSIDKQNVAFRGSRLVGGTEWARGIVIYTGTDSKIMLNRTKPRDKKSTIEMFINWYILVWIGIIIVLAVLSVVLEIFWVTGNVPGAWYLHEEGWSTSQRVVQTVRDFFSFIILYNTLLPIVMYVSYELAQLGQSTFVQKDLKLYDEDSDTPASVKTSAVIEELGQVQYAFVDKTGTLTENDMALVNFSVSGKSFSVRRMQEKPLKRQKTGGQNKVDLPTVEKPTSLQRDDSGVKPRLNHESPMAHYHSVISGGQADASADYGSIMQCPVMSVLSQAMKVVELEHDGNWRTSLTGNVQQIVDLFLCLCLCNTAMPDTANGRFQATSKDEEAFLEAARRLGIRLVRRTTRQLTISVFGEEEYYDLLQLIEFDPNRKRMEAIVRSPQGRIVLICKGADIVVEPLLVPASQRSSTDENMLSQHLQQYGAQGLRTIVCAKTEIPKDKYTEWATHFEEATLALKNRKSRMHTLIQDLEMEFPLHLVGITAVEDKLQEGVPETIDALLLADICCWMLTGDKMETAVSVAKLAHLVDKDDNVVVLQGESENSVFNEIEELLSKLQRAPKNQVISLALTGVQLNFILAATLTQRKRFLALVTQCRTVIGSRLTPKEKASVVNLIRSHLRKITLAVGDGGNDVSMIQAANVGVGIAGVEGLQAANSADVSIAKFRFLRRLLFVHGRSNYRRNSIILLFNCYKSVVLYMTQFFYAFFNGFTQASIHERWTLSVYQQFLTLLPPIIFAIFDRDFSDDVAENAPELYKQGQKHKFFNAKRFAAWILNSVWHSAVCFMVPFLALSQLQLFDGRALDQYCIGVAIYSAVLLVIHGRLILEASSINVLFVLSLIFSAACWVGTVFVLGLLWQLFPYHRHPWREFYSSSEMYLVFFEPSFYVVVLLTAGIALWRDVVWKIIMRGFALAISKQATNALYYQLLSSNKKEKTLSRYREQV